jgi:hypothetical protein
MGMKQLPRRSGECLLEIIMRRHENRSTMMTSNRPLEDWAKLIGDAPAATAILDRFLQHATIINITGKSYRLRHPSASLSNPGSKTEADTPPVAAADSDTTKQTRGRRSTGDGEGLSPPEDTADRKPISSGSGLPADETRSAKADSVPTRTGQLRVQKICTIPMAASTRTLLLGTR